MMGLRIRPSFLRVAWTFAVLALVHPIPSLAESGIPSVTLSTATAQPADFMITPNGFGSSLAEVGGTITLTLVDELGQIIVNFPFQDLWVAGPVGSNIQPCFLGMFADANTNAQGIATFNGRLAGGGRASGLQVYVNATPLAAPPLPIRVNSPDYSGDGNVGIEDLAEFAIEYLNTTYDFDADFNHDGMEDLTDIGIFADSLFNPFCD